MTRKAQIVICGAGITGISAAYSLAKAGVEDILLLDERPPLTLTSDRSTECYRNWWPDPQMRALMDRSIDLMEKIADESGNVIRMNRRGYLYLTGDEAKIPGWIERSARISNFGGGPVRIHQGRAGSYRPSPADGFHGEPAGVDVLVGNDLIRSHFPYLALRAAAALHVRRAGWLSAQQLGMYVLEAARGLGVHFEQARVQAVEVDDDRIRGVELSSGERIESPVFVNAAGPFLKAVGNMLEVDLPVFSELHLKVAFKDQLGIVGRDAPLLVWEDPQLLEWDDEEHAILTEDPESLWLTHPLPGGAHLRPEGGRDSQTILLLWEYKSRVTEPLAAPFLDEQFSEIALRGMSAMLPGLAKYFQRMPRPQLDGGYYTKTRENLPLVGPLPVAGAYVIGAVSGYGIMSAMALGELLARHITGSDLPSYASAFSPERYMDPQYQNKIAILEDTGQL